MDTILSVKSARQRRWAARNVDYLAACARRRRRANPERQLLDSAKARAKQRGLVFDLTLADIVIPAYCPVLGIELRVAEEIHSANSPTIDRVDNAKGYVRGNVLVISFRANTLKRDGTLDEFRAIVNYIESNTTTNYKVTDITQ